MRMLPTAPRFWNDDGIAARLLGPIGKLYDLSSRLYRRLKTPIHLGCPVVCVGNLTLGGAGKTPVAIGLLRHFEAKGLAAHAVSRGYGGRLRGPVRVDPAHHVAADVGDEPLLLARSGPTWVARNRIAGAQAALDAGADLIVLDDGFQNPTLAKDLSIVVVDTGYGFGNRRVFPAGPLREEAENGLARADAAVLLGSDARCPAGMLPANLTVLRASLEPSPEARTLSGRRVLAFAGIARPEKLFDTLTEIGADLVARRSFADHHAYSDREIDLLLREARDLGAIPVTTEKDAVRIEPARRDLVQTVPVRVDWKQPQALARLTEEVLDRSRINVSIPSKELN